MKYLAAYLLLAEGGNASPSVADLKNVIESVGIEFDTARAEELLKSLKGKTVSELVAEGSQKFGALPSGGSGSASGSSGAAAAGGAAAEEAEEEAAAEEAEESDDDMGFGLFD